MRGLTVALFFVGTVAGSAPGLSSAGGFSTSLINPTYNVGPESAWTNPAGMTGVQTSAVAAAVAGVFPIAEFDPDFAGAGGDDGSRPDLAGRTFCRGIRYQHRFRGGRLGAVAILGRTAPSWSRG